MSHNPRYVKLRRIGLLRSRRDVATGRAALAPPLSVTTPLLQSRQRTQRVLRGTGRRTLRGSGGQGAGRAEREACGLRVWDPGPLGWALPHRSARRTAPERSSVRSGRRTSTAVCASGSAWKAGLGQRGSASAERTLASRGRRRRKAPRAPPSGTQRGRVCAPERQGPRADPGDRGLLRPKPRSRRANSALPPASTTAARPPRATRCNSWRSAPSR